MARLHKELNRHLAGSAPMSPDAAADTSTHANVFDPTRQTFLTGALPEVERLLEDLGHPVDVSDLRRYTKPQYAWRLQLHTLRPYQEDVVARATESDAGGLIDIGTGGGKTLLAAAIIARLGLPTLYLVTTRTLLNQARDNLEAYLDVDTGVIGEGTWSPEPTITVALVQSLLGKQSELEPWRDGTLVFDEGHHACARTYLDVIRAVDARYNYYLSAVPFRSGGDQAVLDALTGGRLTDGRYSARYLIDHGFACPVRVQIERSTFTGDVAEKPFWQLYVEAIVENPARNARVVELAAAEIDRGRSVLILVEHIAHGERLVRLLNERVGECGAFISGRSPRGRLRERTQRFTDAALPCLIATAGLFQEGISINGIEVLINAGALKSRAKVLQAVGRGMRLAPGKSHVSYVDFFDDDVGGKFRSHSRRRFEFLAREGFDVPPLPAARAAATAPGGDDDIPPTWAHVHETKRFVKVDAEGAIVARGVCLEKELVPSRYCSKCKVPLCETGGLTHAAT